MRFIKAVSVILFLTGLLFAYGCDCSGHGQPNYTACLIAPDGTVTKFTTDNNGDFSFTPASGTSCSDYQVSICPNGMPELE
jgi:hypothetical protein